MLRTLVLALLLANAGTWAYTQGWLAPWLPAAVGGAREPDRVTAQVRPEAVRLLNGARPASEPSPTPPAPPVAAAATSSPADGSEAPAPTACFEAGGFTPAQAELLRAEFRLLGWGGTLWQLNEVRSPARWLVYMGRYDTPEQAARKKAELRALGVAHRDVTTPGLSPGLALGTYSTEAAARTALDQAARGGVRTARVVQEREESLSFNLRLPAITDAQRRTVDGLRGAMGGRSLQACDARSGER
jgi:hypothetical protein